MYAANPAGTFLIEAADLLDQVEEIVLDLERRPDDPDAVDRLFRAFHTIKGSGAMFGFEAVAAFTHHVESTLDDVRQGRLAFSPALARLILEARDDIKQKLAGGAVEAGTGPEASGRITEALIAMRPAAAALSPRPAAPIPVERGAVATYAIRFKPNPALASCGLDPASLLAELRALGPCEIALDASALPAFGALEPAQCLFAWNIRLTTDRGLNAIKDVFIFAEDGAELRIVLVESAEPDAPAAPMAIPKLAPAGGHGGAGTVADASADATAPRGVRSIREGVVRVGSAKLDHLVSLVGELVMNESRLSQVAARVNVGELSAPVEAIERLIAELRDAVLGIRMMPIGSTFSRFKRLVHDLARDLGKEVELVTEGGETELDKTVLDQLADPLVHLIRNSIDHGIETPAERVAAGKPSRGVVRLTATHAGSHVIVTIEDDGRGLDAAAIRARAIERRLIAADATPTEADLFNFIFLPGFSTAKNVTAVSGRGVGMDVVRKQIDALCGGIQLASEPGRGTTLSLALPLTLAIIEGLLVTLAGDPFIIPMSVVLETVELPRADRRRNNGRNLVTVRGELVPYVPLRELFDAPGEEPAIEKIVIVRFGRDRVGLVVDRVVGSHQTVIQPLGRMFKDLGVVSGGTILGDGRVALILDLGGVIACTEKSRDSNRLRASARTAKAAA